MKKLLTLLLLAAAFLLAAAPQKLKPFRLQLDPKQDTYIITPKQSGVFWIVSSTKAKIPVGIQLQPERFQFLRGGGEQEGCRQQQKGEQFFHVMGLSCSGYWKYCKKYMPGM